MSDAESRGPGDADECAYVCPACGGSLAATLEALACRGCGARYPVENGIADFSGGDYYDRFFPGQELSPSEREGLVGEVRGAVSRIRDYYLPLLVREGSRNERPLRVLDSGCGNGISVDLLREAGLDAFGIDLSALRKWQWRDRTHPESIACAGGTRLPFRDGFFDAILCSGVLEHVGVVESGGEAYSVRALPDRDAARLAFLAEQARVLSPGGVLLLDFPNGVFPVDFWHGSRAGGARWHRRDEDFLPTAAEVRGYAARLPQRLSVRVLGPLGRLQFRQVGRHWYGRLFAGPVRLWLRALGWSALSRLRETAANPFLVIALRKPR